MADGGIDTKREGGVLDNLTGRGDMEANGGDPSPPLTTGMQLHDALHRFREGRGTGTATLEAKLLQQLAAMREEVLYVIFLNLTKVYDALDRSRSLDILK